MSQKIDKKIIFIFGSIRTGGYQTINVSIANALLHRGINVKILLLSDSSSHFYNLDKSVELENIKYSKKRIIYYLLQLYLFFRKLKDGIVITNTVLDYIYAKIVALFFKNIYVYWAIHYTKPSTKRSLKLHKLLSRFLKLFKNNFIAIHKSQIQYYKQTYGFKKKDFNLIYNGVNTDKFRPSNRKLNKTHSDAFYIVHVASIKPLKDQTTLLKAVNYLNKSVGKWKLYIAGEDRASMLHELKNYVIENKIEDKVYFLGNTENIASLLTNSDVFVLTSTTEALPVSIMEAMACGLPIISTDVGGCSELVADGENGFLTEVKDFEGIGKKLKELYSDDEMKKKMGEESRNRAIKFFSEEKMINGYLTIVNNFYNNLSQDEY